MEEAILYGVSIKSNEIRSHPLTQHSKSICLLQSHMINITYQHHHGYLISSLNVASANQHTPPLCLVLANGQISCSSQHANPYKSCTLRWQEVLTMAVMPPAHTYINIWNIYIYILYNILPKRQQKQHWITAHASKWTCLKPPVVESKRPQHDEVIVPSLWRQVDLPPDLWVWLGFWSTTSRKIRKLRHVILVEDLMQTKLQVKWALCEGVAWFWNIKSKGLKTEKKKNGKKNASWLPYSCCHHLCAMKQQPRFCWLQCVPGKLLRQRWMDIKINNDASVTHQTELVG